jgi:DNA invertase Pin-like site-specific DNA recombinase
MRKIGYLRVSTGDQSFDRQLDALRPMCDALYIETLSAVSKRRPLYEKATRRLRRGDTFVVLDTDRAYRDARDALNELHRLDQRGIMFSALNFWMDTTKPEGRFALTVKLAADELERNTLSRRTKEGMAAARKRGARIGRPLKLSEHQIVTARRRIAQKRATKRGIAREYGVGRSTLDRALSRPSASIGA